MGLTGGIVGEDEAATSWPGAPRDSKDADYVATWRPVGSPLQRTRLRWQDHGNTDRLAINIIASPNHPFTYRASCMIIDSIYSTLQ
jgi:hypothetical protein